MLKVDESHLIQMDISWWTRPGMHKLQYLTPLWWDSVCSSLPRMDERASAKLACQTTATQLFPTRGPPRPKEQANEERSWIQRRWALVRNWNLHEIHFIPSNKLRCDLLQSIQSSWGLLLSCLPFQQTPERFQSAQAPKLASKLEIWKVFHCQYIHFDPSLDPRNVKITLVLENVVSLKVFLWTAMSGSQILKIYILLSTCLLFSCLRKIRQIPILCQFLSVLPVIFISNRLVTSH